MTDHLYSQLELGKILELCREAHSPKFATATFATGKLKQRRMCSCVTEEVNVSNSTCQCCLTGAMNGLEPS